MHVIVRRFGMEVSLDRFLNRSDAGRQLAARLATLSDFSNAIVFGLPRGGVPVAYEVAVELNLPLDVIVVRKIGVPFQREVAMGAIGEDGVVVVEDEVIAATNISSKEFAIVEARERAELGRRIEKFRGNRPPRSLVGRTALIVDDGIATGATSRAACRVARARGAARVVLAVPVASARTAAEFRGEADEVVVLVAASGSFSVGQWYEEFDETPDSEVVECLRRASSRGFPFAEPGDAHV
jgi:putative phosphoribosyl transferase